MAIVFGSPEAQEILRRDKAQALWESRHLAGYEEDVQLLATIESQLLDLMAEINDLSVNRDEVAERVRFAQKLKEELGLT